jgi:hypothetical protein
MGVEQYKARQDTEGKEHESEEAQMVFAPTFSYYTEYKSKNDFFAFLVFVSFDMKNENHVK